MVSSELVNHIPARGEQIKLVYTFVKLIRLCQMFWKYHDAFDIQPNNLISVAQKLHIGSDLRWARRLGNARDSGRAWLYSRVWNISLSGRECEKGRNQFENGDCAQKRETVLYWHVYEFETDRFRRYHSFDIVRFPCHHDNYFTNMSQNSSAHISNGNIHIATLGFMVSQIK